MVFGRGRRHEELVRVMETGQFDQLVYCRGYARNACAHTCEL